MEEFKHETDEFLLSMSFCELMTGEGVLTVCITTKEEKLLSRLIAPNIKDKEKICFEHIKQILENQGPLVGYEYLRDKERFIKETERLAAKKEGEKIGDATLTTTKTVGRKKV